MFSSEGSAKKTKGKKKKTRNRRTWGVGVYPGVLGEGDKYYFICPTCDQEHVTKEIEDIEFIKKKLNE